MKHRSRNENEQITVSAFRTEVSGNPMPRTTFIRANEYLQDPYSLFEVTLQSG